MPAAALAQARSATACDPIRGNALRQSGLEALASKHYEVAERLLREALEACPNQRELLLDLSRTYVYRRQFDAAIQAAQRFLESEPDSVPGRLALANAYLLAQRFSSAREQAERVLKTAPHDALALKIKGNAEYFLGEHERALDTFIGLLDRHPDDAEAAYMLGRVYYQDGRIDLAIGQFQRVLRLDPYAYKAYDNLGLCYEAQGDTEAAIRHYLTAIKLVEKDHPDYDWPYANLANLLVNKGNAEQAFAAASKAADRNPRSARNFYLGGKALCKMGKTELCANWLERSAALDPNYPEPLYLLARVYSELGKEQKAKETLKKFQAVKAKVPPERR